MSRTIDGLDVKVEGELQESLPGGVCVDPIMADTKLPTVKEPDVLYDRQGTKSVKVTGKAGSRSFTVSENGREKVYKLSTSDFPGRDLTLVGFMDGVAVVFTDTQKIYVANLSQSTGLVTTILNNTVQENKLVDVVLSEDESRIAFISETGSVRKLYSLFLETGQRTEPATMSENSRILQFN
jgi:Tol biopolymer transport system component